MNSQDQSAHSVQTTQRVRASLQKRYAAEKRFKLYGLLAIGASIAFLFILLISIVSKGLPAFSQSYVKLDVNLATDTLGISKDSTDAELRKANYSGVLRSALRERFPEVTKRRDRKELYKLISTGAQYDLFDRIKADRSQLDSTQTLWVMADDELSAILKSNADLTAPDSIVTRLSDQQIGWAKTLKDDGYGQHSWAQLSRF